MAAHTDEELALLGILATGIGSRQQQTNGVTPGLEVGLRAHADMLELQRHVLPDSADADESDGHQRGPSLREWLHLRHG